MDRGYVRTVDVVPTMARMLGLRVPWRVDGRPAGSSAIARRSGVRMPTRSFARVVSINSCDIERRRRANIARRAGLFETGAESAQRIGSPWGSVYRAGPDPGLFGRRLRNARILPPGALRAALDEPSSWRAADLRSRALPLEVSGRILGGLPGARRTIAVAVNRRVCGIQRTYALRGRESFAVIVPDGCLREGRNEVRVFVVAGGGRRPRLAPLPLG